MGKHVRPKRREASGYVGFSAAMGQALDPYERAPAHVLPQGHADQPVEVKICGRRKRATVR